MWVSIQCPPNCGLPHLGRAWEQYRFSANSPLNPKPETPQEPSLWDSKMEDPNKEESVFSNVRAEFARRTEGWGIAVQMVRV